MNIKKRILALVMSAAMIFTFMPAMAFAEGETQEGAEAAAAEPAVVRFANQIHGVVGTDNTDLYTIGNAIEVFDEEENVLAIYEYEQYTYKGEDGTEYTGEGFLIQGEDRDLTSETALAEVSLYEEEPYVFKEGFNDVKIFISIPYETEEGVTAKSFIVDGKVFCGVTRPVKVEFVPADGFVAEGCIGDTYIDESNFFGEGNAFKVTYEYKTWDDADGGEVKTLERVFSYMKEDEEKGINDGFFWINDQMPDYPMYIPFSFDTYPECHLVKGDNAVPLSYTEYFTDDTEPVTIDFEVNVRADKYYAYANWQTFDYTGKYITKSQFAKKLVVRNSLDKKIPATEYSFSFKKQKKMGWYTVEIKLKNPDQYDEPVIYADYCIGPKTPVVSKVTGGKKALTVSWKKFSAKQLKSIGNMYIEVARDKNFISGYKVYKVSAKELKKGSKTLKKLAAKKKYYVRMYTNKKISQNGEKFYVYSNDSNIKAAKTK